MAAKTYPIPVIEGIDCDAEEGRPGSAKSFSIRIYYDSEKGADHYIPRSDKNRQNSRAETRTIPNGSIESILAAEGRSKSTLYCKPYTSDIQQEETNGVDQKPDQFNNSMNENKPGSSSKRKGRRTKNKAKPSLCWSGKASSAESEDSDTRPQLSSMSGQPPSFCDNMSDVYRIDRRTRKISEQSVRDSSNRLEVENMGYHIIDPDEIPRPDQCYTLTQQQQPRSKRSFCTIL